MGRFTRLVGCDIGGGRQRPGSGCLVAVVPSTIIVRMLFRISGRRSSFFVFGENPREWIEKVFGFGKKPRTLEKCHSLLHIPKNASWSDEALHQPLFLASDTVG